MNPLAQLRRLQAALRLYDALSRGDTKLLIEQFPFVKVKLAPKIVPPREPKKPLPPPQITYAEHSDADDLRDALDIGFGQLKFDPEPDGEFVGAHGVRPLSTSSILHDIIDFSQRRANVPEPIRIRSRVAA